MSQSRISRRAILSTFSGLAAGSFFKGLLRDAFADQAPALPRFVVLSNPHGCPADLWRPRGPGGAAAAETGWNLDYDPDSALGPLEPHKDSLVIIEGLDLTCNYTALDPILTGHNGGNVAPLTGRHPRVGEENSVRTDGPSIDHVVSKRLATSPFYFKPLGYAGSAAAISYDDAGERIPCEYDLRDSYKKWFGSFTGGGTDTGASARSAADLAVVSYLKDDANRLRSRLAGSERLKVDAHLDALALLENRLRKPAAISCEKPPAAAAAGLEETSLRTVMDFGVELFACGLTQAMTLILDVGQTMPWVGLGELKMHDDVAHGYRPDDATSVRQLAKLQRWYAAQVAYLIERLKAIPEADGTAYDHTIILWTNELGDPARHMNNNIPYVLAGGGGAHAKGRYLELGHGSEYRDAQNPNNALLTSIANLYGLDLAGFGDPKFPGELSGFRG
jgi:hypothetical protein